MKEQYCFFPDSSPPPKKTPRRGQWKAHCPKNPDLVEKTQPWQHWVHIRPRTWHFAAAAFSGVAKYADFKMYEEEGMNTTDVDASLQQLKDNDAKLKELNLNNIKVDAWKG